MYKENYTQGNTLPDWIVDAGKANAVTGADKDRAAEFFKEHRNTLSQEQVKQLHEIIVRKKEIEVRAPELILPNDSQNIHTCARCYSSTSPGPRNISGKAAA